MTQDERERFLAGSTAERAIQIDSFLDTGDDASAAEAIVLHNEHGGDGHLMLRHCLYSFTSVAMVSRCIADLHITDMRNLPMPEMAANMMGWIKAAMYLDSLAQDATTDTALAANARGCAVELLDAVNRQQWQDDGRDEILLKKATAINGYKAGWKRAATCLSELETMAMMNTKPAATALRRILAMPQAQAVEMVQ